MKSAALLVTLVGAVAFAAGRSAGPANGALILDGGGATDVVVRRFVELAGGPAARIIAFPTGASAVGFGEGNTMLDPDWPRNHPYYWLNRGDRFDLATWTKMDAARSAVDRRPLGS